VESIDAVNHNRKRFYEANSYGIYVVRYLIETRWINTGVFGKPPIDGKSR
jgi:hypothetical protein